jgi:hypothetical protein
MLQRGCVGTEKAYHREVVRRTQSKESSSKTHETCDSGLTYKQQCTETGKSTSGSGPKKETYPEAPDSASLRR